MEIRYNKRYPYYWTLGSFTNFYQNFFRQNVNFNIRLRSTSSDTFEQVMCVPQGSILSVTLFSIKINSFAYVLRGDKHGCLYVDDFVLCYKSKNINSVERQLQLRHNKNSKLGQ